MGVIEIIGVDPHRQRRGISSRLTEHATEHMQRCRMDIVVVETGGAPGHGPARAAYEAAGFTLLPIARYFPNARVTFRNAGPCDGRSR